MARDERDEGAGLETLNIGREGAGVRTGGKVIKD